MIEEARQKAYDDQINEIVQGFMQVWIKFESLLADELVGVQNQLSGIQPGNEHHPASSYQLFYRVSSSLYRKSYLTMGELSSALSVPLSTATRIVDWMVDRGYTHRLPDPEDRRIVRIALTDSGNELHQTIERYIRQRVQQILSCLAGEERNTLVNLVRKVVFALRGVTG